MFGRLLAMFAHPDDESYGPAGTIREAAALPGGKVRIVTATRGEAGSLGISRSYGPDGLARVRQGELFAAARLLEAEVVLLGWPDKGIGALAAESAVAQLVREIRLFRPDSVLTFHPNGLSGHPDHIAMTALVGEAIRRSPEASYRPDLGAAWRPARLLYYAICESKAAAVRSLRTMHAIPDTEVDLTLDTRPHLARKHAACLAHGTQTPFHDQLLGVPGGLDAYWSHEHLVLAEVSEA
jgi:LmbE family N-acetylglucosaminyl deacetylase